VDNNRRTHTIAAAVEAAGVPHVVLLSAIGAQQSDGTGPVLGLRDAETVFSRAKAAATFVRAAYFMENWSPDLWGFGDGKKAFFRIKQGKPDPAAIHCGFVAENENTVDEFYEAAMSAGAMDNISPRARLEYYPGYYAADVFDPDGYSFEVVHKS